MNHYMKLATGPFEMMASGNKTIELRLYDEKRQAIQKGDTIVFSNIVDGKKLTAEVVKLHLFATFLDLYDALPLEKCGYSPDSCSTASYTDMEEYYSLEEQHAYGVVGIELRVIDKE